MFLYLGGIHINHKPYLYPIKMTTSSITFLRPIQVAIIIIVTAFVSWSCRQPEGDTASTEQINNTKGDKHVKITGTHVYIVPPEVF